MKRRYITEFYGKKGGELASSQPGEELEIKLTYFVLGYKGIPTIILPKRTTLSSSRTWCHRVSPGLGIRTVTVYGYGRMLYGALRSEAVPDP